MATGKRAGKRAGPKKKASFRPTALLLAIGITLGVGAWGYLVKAAIDFGIQARQGTAGAWTFLALACFGAVACLFVGLMLVARLLRSLGVTAPREPRAPKPDKAPHRHAGSHRH